VMIDVVFLDLLLSGLYLSYLLARLATGSLRVVRTSW